MSDDGFHKHHRQLRRGGDDRPVNLLRVGPVLHDWIHKHPAEAAELGWIVSQYDDPAEVIVTIPDTIVEKPKRKKQASTPEERKARINFTIRTPKDEENVIPELLELLRQRVGKEMGWSDTVPSYHIVVLALHHLLEAAG